MKETVNRPQRLALSELDAALQSALQRAAQARELSQEECQSVGGGTPILRSPITFGFQLPFPTRLPPGVPSEPFNY